MIITADAPAGFRRSVPGRSPRFGWTYESACSVGGCEVVSPILSNTAETWQGLRKVCGVISVHGGTPRGYRLAHQCRRVSRRRHPPAIRGINGDVREPSHIIWLRHGHPRRLCAPWPKPVSSTWPFTTPDPCRDDPEPFDTPMSGPLRYITKCGIRS